MIRLYKRDDAGQLAAYHEAWIEPQNRRIVEHWGYLGDAGDTKTHRIKLLGSLERQFEQVLVPARALGFEELAESAFASLIVVYDVSGAAPDTARDKQIDIEDALTEKLGWTGLGYCAEGRLDGAQLEICCRVVDVDLAQTTVSEALDGSVFSDYSRIYQE
ncbi:MAG: hypothetical protein AAFY82_07910 [Pseudomonadota bacterium]